MKLEIFRCHDGDTCKARSSAFGILTLRFAGIDTPEIGQPPKAMGEKARDRLMELTINQPCEGDLLGADVYGRQLALVSCRGTLVNETLVREGLAYAYINWRYRDFGYSWATRAETRARIERRGLFGIHQGLQSPHRFRINKRTESHQTTNSFAGDAH